MLLSNGKIYNQNLFTLPSGKLLINTLNAYSYNIAQKDPLFEKALMDSNILLPDGISVVLAVKWLTRQRLKKIAGEDLFFYEMERLQKSGGKCFFLGSSEDVLAKIQARAKIEFHNIQIQIFSPPFKQEFTAEENSAMVEKINRFQPDVLFIGMTAPKQEKWAWQQFNQLQAGHICCIGAVFDFYAGTIKRAPKWIIRMGLEWLYRLIKEPQRMWRRYLIGNAIFIWGVIREKVIKENPS